MRILGAGDMIEELKRISAEIARSHSLHAYEAVDIAWVAPRVGEILEASADVLRNLGDIVVAALTTRKGSCCWMESQPQLREVAHGA